MRAGWQFSCTRGKRLKYQKALSPEKRSECDARHIFLHLQSEGREKCGEMTKLRGDRFLAPATTAPDSKKPRPLERDRGFRPDSALLPYPIKLAARLVNWQRRVVLLKPGSGC
jgi:hypothetical protein